MAIPADFVPEERSPLAPLGRRTRLARFFYSASINGATSGRPCCLHCPLRRLAGEKRGAGRSPIRYRPKRGLNFNSPLRPVARRMSLEAGKILDVLILLMLANGAPLVAKQLLGDRRCYPWTATSGSPMAGGSSVRQKPN